MKRKPTFAPDIGAVTISAQSKRNPIPDLAYQLKHLLKVCRVDRETRKAHLLLVVKMAEQHAVIAGWGDDRIIAELTDALSHYAPPYTYFGERDGDYGFWPSVNGHWDDCDLPRLEAGDEKGHAEFWGEDVLLVNDHGNIECGRFDLRGRFLSYWSAV